MSKYDPLFNLLNRQKAKTIILTFKEIEGIIGDSLPSSARKKESNWWENPSDLDKAKHTQAYAWA